MSVSIKVAIRCRPFTEDGRLGVKMRQLGDEEGEVELLNSTYSTDRFPFTYSWWSAYGYQRHCAKDDMQYADEMTMVDQDMAYSSCGQKIKADLMTGNAVVLFAYGLSGSGKTFTVFGPDATDVPEAWYKHSTPQPLWGIFPRLAYEIFQEKQDGWKISMKYFQNVVDTVRDLMSPNADEQHYKNGMRKDPDGFMDIEWCSSRVIHSWDDLRETFHKANQRKAIAPTQFNPMSTRGHCIMVLEVEMPHPETEGMKQRGRVYVCDLAGTEPAGDIFFAQYNKVSFDDGSFEYKMTGPHPDPKKTKELQEQGKKINLSLSEMAQFFMKMAEAVKAKKLQPGMTIPGCNSFFLCKYLKDTMLQARTYLFCAIRPEVEFLKYTFATLGFAKNASVVKLAPKKATVAASAGERKLLAELDAMKALVAQLQSQSGGNSDAAKMIADLQSKLAAKQQDLSNEMGEDGRGSKIDEQAEQQRVEYAKRGISLAAYDAEGNTAPYFTNLDEDAFRSNRFMYIINKEWTVFGNKGDIQLMSLTVLRDHCKVKAPVRLCPLKLVHAPLHISFQFFCLHACALPISLYFLLPTSSLPPKVKFDGSSVFIIAGKGDTWHNGRLVPEGKEAQVAAYDRVALGDQLMLFRWPGHETEGVEPMSAEDAVNEFQAGLVSNRAGGDHGDRLRISEEREKWEKEKAATEGPQRNEQEYQNAMKAVDNAILDLLPKTKEAKQIVDLFNRVNMSFDVVLEKGQDHIPRVKISVVNSNPKLSILLDPQEFLPKLSLLKDEMAKMKSAIDANREYMLPERHDPVFLLMDNDFHLGTATHWPEYLIYNLPTDDEEAIQDIKNAAVPYNNIGLLEVRWRPLAGPNEEDQGKSSADDIEGEESLLGKSWCYEISIVRSSDLPVYTEMSYVSYTFFGETFVTEGACSCRLPFSLFFSYVTTLPPPPPPPPNTHNTINSRAADDLQPRVRLQEGAPCARRDEGLYRLPQGLHRDADPRHAARREPPGQARHD